MERPMTQRANQDVSTAIVEQAIRTLLENKPVQPTLKEIQDEIRYATGQHMAHPLVVYHMDKLADAGVIVRHRRGVWELVK